MRNLVLQHIWIIQYLCWTYLTYSVYRRMACVMLQGSDNYRKSFPNSNIKPQKWMNVVLKRDYKAITIFSYIELYGAIIGLIIGLTCCVLYYAFEQDYDIAKKLFILQNIYAVLAVVVLFPYHICKEIAEKTK